MGGSQAKQNANLENQLSSTPKIDMVDSVHSVHINVKQSVKIDHSDHLKMILGKKRNNDSHIKKGSEKSPSQSFVSGDNSKKDIKSPDYSNLDDSSHQRDTNRGGKVTKTRRQEMFQGKSPRSMDQDQDSDKIVIEEQEGSPSPIINGRVKVNIFKKAAAKKKQAQQNELKNDIKLNVKAIVNEASRQHESVKTDTMKNIKNLKMSQNKMKQSKFNISIASNLSEQDHSEQQKLEVLCKDVIASKTHDEELNLKIQKIMEKHAFIKYWHRGPNLDQKNQNLFVKDDKVIIIDEDELHKDQNIYQQNQNDVLGELLQQNINPIQFIIGDKTKIWEQVKAEEERVTKERKEQETKRLIKKSDVRMTIYPSFDNFFQSNYKQQ